MEIITGVKRRRRWRDEDKLRVLAEVAQPGVRMSEVARRHDISRGLLWYWRRQGRRAVRGASEPMFLPSAAGK
jgi:transposase